MRYKHAYHAAFLVRSLPVSAKVHARLTAVARPSTTPAAHCPTGDNTPDMRSLGVAASVDARDVMVVALLGATHPVYRCL